ncbi:response regulator [Paenibacillus filicis]|uniref:Response regulator n=1 Tax=Paenibacillus filicis TaxID=669464 RepID=A0ABU9DH48_9BACL
MWKLMIADDEPRIRYGLRKVLSWEEMGIEVVAEAENGQEALEIAETVRPDLMFMDINMPFVSGLEVIERLRDMLPDCVVIVISGHDEFAYAQRAVRLNVFDYVLKPVQKEELQVIVQKALQTLQKEQLEQKYNHWMNQKFEVSSAELREQFLRNWVAGNLDDRQLQEELQFFGMRFPEQIGLLLIKPLLKVKVTPAHKIWDPQLLEFAVKNILMELLAPVPSSAAFGNGKGHLCVVTPIGRAADWHAFLQDFERTLSFYLGVQVLTAYTVAGCIAEIPERYTELVMDLNASVSLTPIVLMTKKYLETFYYKEDLSLTEVAEQMNVNANYLSKLLKKETGQTFVDAVTQIRIQKATQLLNDPMSKMYEVAEQVGYQSQHYFSHIFKKVTGLSPLEYRKRGERYDR